MKRNRESYYVLPWFIRAFRLCRILTPTRRSWLTSWSCSRFSIWWRKKSGQQKIKDRVRAPEMEGNRVRKRKKMAVFFRVSACRIFKIKKQKNKKKKIGKKVKSKLIIKYNRGKTSMQIQNLRNRKRFSNNNRDLSQSSVCYNHILSCGYFSCEDKRKKTTWNYKEIFRNKFLSCEPWISKNGIVHDFP